MLSVEDTGLLLAFLYENKYQCSHQMECLRLGRGHLEFCHWSPWNGHLDILRPQCKVNLMPLGKCNGLVFFRYMSLHIDSSMSAQPPRSKLVHLVTSIFCVVLIPVTANNLSVRSFAVYIMTYLHVPVMKGWLSVTAIAMPVS